MVVPVRALLTGQLAFASSAARLNPSADSPGTRAVTLRWMPVMPSPGWNVTSALVSSSSAVLPPLAAR